MAAIRGVSPELPSDGWAYRPLRRVGQGSSGHVWLCQTRDGSESVAVKVGSSPAEGARLAGEAERLILAEAQNTPALLDAGTVAGRLGDAPAVLPYIALSWVEGDTARSAAARSGERLRLAAEVVRDVALALSDLHLLGLAHGDVKPDNIVVRSAASAGPGRAVLVDFGLADSANERTARGGTPRYLAPEALDGSGGSDGRMRDVWALGVTLVELCGGDQALSSPVDDEDRAPLARTLAGLARALMAPSPTARPSAAWAYRTAAAALGIEPSSTVEARQQRIIRAYLGCHTDALHRAALGHPTTVDVEGTPGAWLKSAVQRLGRTASLRSVAPDRDPQRVSELGPLGRARWLQRVIEASIAHWPLPHLEGDADLADRLLDLARTRDPRALTYADLTGVRHTSAELRATLPEHSGAPPRARRDVTGPGVSKQALVDERAPERGGSDPVGIALALGKADVSDVVLEAAEGWVLRHEAPDAIVIATGRALRRRGAIGRASVVFARAPTAEALVEEAETARRQGQRDQALAFCGRTRERLSTSSALRARLDALEARIHLDQGDLDRAERTRPARPQTAMECEVAALVALGRRDNRSAIDAAEAGIALAEDDEERARLEAVRGGAMHAAGDGAGALIAFRRAAEHAARVGAMVEEATYLTGLAASAFDSGCIDEALSAAQRSALLFEHLGRRSDAARALLVPGSVYASVGARLLAREAARDAIDRARAAGDSRCRAYGHLILADALAESSLACEHATRALSLVGDEPGDRLRALSRLLDHGGLAEVEEGDGTSRDPSVSVTVRLEWWGARARRLLTAPDASNRTVLTELSALATTPGPIPTRGPALAAGAALAARMGDGDLARRLSLPASEAARQLALHAPPALKHAAEGLPWATAVLAPASSALSPGQLGDVETLVRALGTRDRLRPLLDQVLDALVLWSGVERGLLLLRAPGQRLVPRAARNLAREDLVGEQLELSRSLAERALASGEPVVAVDATGELSEVHESVHALKLRSVLCVPLIARGQALGVVYLDDRVRRGAFGPAEKAWARLVATIAAVAIADARDQLLLRRTARRARRAEARLARELATREAELDAAKAELAASRDGRDTRFDYEAIVGTSEPITRMLRLIDRVAASEVPVLITGESGTGKELVARAIVENGPRKSGQFVTENCSAIPDGLLESALFGHTRGAFTGASRARVGLFEVANDGTLFLDEVGEMSLPMQAKLLRVLENGEIKPVGSERTRKVDVRVIAATHRDLATMVRTGTFREDLYYRLNVIAVHVPPLRERREDIAILTRHFIDKHSSRPIRIAPDAQLDLTAHGWPGNVRQLENEVRRALVLADDVITASHLSAQVRGASRGDSPAKSALDLRRRVDALEADLVREALGQTSGNQTRAAELLGLSRFGLQKMIKRLHIDVSSVLDKSAPRG